MTPTPVARRGSATRCVFESAPRSIGTKPGFGSAARVGWLAFAAMVCASAGEAPAQEEPRPKANSNSNSNSNAIAVSAEHAAEMRRGLELFRETVGPLLKAHCLDCHGGGSVKAGFDLSTRERLLSSGTLEREPGEDAGATRFVAVIRHDEEPGMPYKADKLPDAAIEAIAEWAALGAPYDGPLTDADEGGGEARRGIGEAERNFWSFRPLRAVAPPSGPFPGASESDARTPIDRFLLEAQRAAGVTPNPRASRATLIRRATFDLTGLPPTPEEIEAFESDPASDEEAFEKVVDRLLASPRHGERQARLWMDVARFAESHGYEQDYDRPYAYVYRDFLIRAFNEDMPFDRFARLQIAGDEWEPDNPWAMAATGFLGGGAFPTQLTEAEFESARYDELDDMTATTGTAFLGLTIGCARCHDHKYDPIRSEEYYRLASTFATTIRSEIDLPLGPNGASVKAQVTSEGLPPTKHHADDRGFPHFYPEVHVLERGDPKRKGELATPGAPEVLTRGGRTWDAWRVEPPEGWTRTSFRRASLSRWLTDVDAGAGALLARVIANRVWRQHFGRGIVETPSDFGFQGDPPTHPELLEWLAAELVQNGWSLKHLRKRILTTAAYARNGDFDERRGAIDRVNALVWRRAPERLEAEAIRDAMLFVSGRLDETMHGPGSPDPNMTRRSVYFFIKRSKLIPTMMLFDWPEHLVGIGARGRTTTAPQALMFLNSPMVGACAEAFADRLERESGSSGDSSARLIRAHLLALGRAPDAEETEAARAFLESQAEARRAAGESDDSARRAALVDYCQALFGLNEFIYVD